MSKLDSNMYKCKYCDKQYTSITYLYRHYITKHHLSIFDILKIYDKKIWYSDIDILEYNSKLTCFNCGDKLSVDYRGLVGSICKCKIDGFNQITSNMYRILGDNWELAYNRFIDLSKQTPENYKKRYGDQWETKWNEHLDIIKQSPGSFKNRYGNNWKAKWDEYVSKLKRVNSKDHYIETYGDKLGIEKYNEIQNKRKRTLDNFIKESNGDIKEGTIKYENWKNRSGNSLEKKIRRHGKTLGIKKYINGLKSINQMKYSMLSQSVFFGIYNIIDTSGFNFYFPNLNHEFVYYDRQQEIVYQLDFVAYDKKLKKLKVIEFDGDNFHANPAIYNENDRPCPFHNELTSNDIWKIDEKRNQSLKNKGAICLRIWESDYKNDMRLIKKLCVKYVEADFIDLKSYIDDNKLSCLRLNDLKLFLGV